MPERPILSLLMLLCWTLPAMAQEIVVTGRVDLVNAGGKPSQGQQSNTVVWLTPLQPAAAQSEAGKVDPAKHVRLTQKNKGFDPHVLVIPAGTSVEFPNLDSFFHNVFSLFEGKRFDLGLYEAGGTRFVQFDRPGISYIFCNIHPEMSATVIALSTPYFGRTDGFGNLAIRAVPAGRYVLHIWSERASPESAEAAAREVTLAADSSSLGTIKLQLTTDSLPSHKNKYGRDYDKPVPSNPVYEQP